MPAFERAGVVVVNPQVAVADELAQLAGASPLSHALAGTDTDVGAARLSVTNPIAQGALQSHSILRGALVVTVKRGRRTVVPTGKTVVLIGDILTIVGRPDVIERARAFFEGTAQVEG
jgi:Trk K+ transport system NAD-binding subunit